MDTNITCPNICGEISVPTGARGYSAYELAVMKGYEGSLAEWLDSLQGKDGVDGTNGKSAYELAVENGYEGTPSEWLASLEGTKLPENPSSSSSQIIVATPIYKYKDTDPEELKSYIGKPLMEVTNGYGNGDGHEADVTTIKGKTYYIKPYYNKRLVFNIAGETAASSSGYTGIVTSVNFDYKRDVEKVIPINPKTLLGKELYDANFPDGRQYFKNEFSLADNSEPTSMTIPVRTSEGQIVANPGSLPYMVTVNKQLNEVKEELATAIDNLGYDATNPKHETVNVSVTGDAGWWRIAEKSLRADSVNNIFRVSIMGQNWSEIMFVASQAAGKAPTIAVINHQMIQGKTYHTLDNAIIQGIRIQYTKGSSSSEYTKAYLEIYVQYPLDATFVTTSIIKRGVEIAPQYQGDWTLLCPNKVDDTPTMECFEKSAIDTIWANVTAKTEDIDYAANNIKLVESNVKKIQSSLESSETGTVLYETLFDVSSRGGLLPDNNVSFTVISNKPLDIIWVGDTSEFAVGCYFVGVDNDTHILSVRGNGPNGAGPYKIYNPIISEWYDDMAFIFSIWGGIVEFGSNNVINFDGDDFEGASYTHTKL